MNTLTPATDLAETRPSLWHPQAPDGLAITRVQIGEPRASRRSGPRVLLAANSHIDLRSDGHGEVEARVTVSEPSSVTLRLHLLRADGATLRTLDIPPLFVAQSARWKDWRAQFTFPAGEYAELAAVDLEFDDAPAQAEPAGA